MTQRIPSPQPPRPTLSPEVRARRRAKARRRRAVLVGSFFVSVILMGGFAWQRLGKTDGSSALQAGSLFQGTIRAEGHEAALNGGVLSNAVQVQLVLEQVRQERGRLPDGPEAFNQWVLPRLKGGMLPRSPWGGVQKGILGVTPELKQAIAAGEADRWVLGAGRTARMIELPTDYGALIYEARGQDYRLYGIGKGLDGNAVVLVRLTPPQSP